MKETAFVPNGLAIKLRDKGFNEPCFMVYDSMGFLQDEKLMDELALPKVNAPLYQEVQDWFMENHNIKVDWELGRNPTNYYPVVNEYDLGFQHNYKHDIVHWFDSSKLALNDAILLALEEI